MIFLAQPALKEWSTDVATPVHKQKNYQVDLPQVKTYFRKDLLFIMLFVAAIFAVTIPVVQSTVALTNAQHELQAIRKEQNRLQIQNTNAKQEISELSSRSRLSKVAASAGLKLNESSTRNVTK